VREAMKSSLLQLQLDYVDLYLIHSPNAKAQRLEQWQTMEELKDEGLTKSIGVSNYGIHHLQELLAVAKHLPVLNQIEVNPYITRSELCSFCVEKNILVEAYSPLTKGQKLNDPKLVAIAEKYQLSTAQLMIRWCLQQVSHWRCKCSQ
jgi:diketogulonate reductase-like aldo/keto reductase